MLNVAEIQSEVASAIEAVDEHVSQVKRKISFQLLSDLIEDTPVDTGRARNGWDLTADQPSDYVPPEGQDRYPAPDAGLMIVALNDSDPFGVIWIVNNVVYIVALDEGHSSRSPAGMTSVALANLRAIT